MTWPGPGEPEQGQGGWGQPGSDPRKSPWSAQQPHEQPPAEPPPAEQPQFGQPYEYGQQPYEQPQYGQQPYGQPPYGQEPYGQPQYPPMEYPPTGYPPTQPYEQLPYGQSPYGQPDYLQQPFGSDPYAQAVPPPPFDPAAPQQAWAPPPGPPPNNNKKVLAIVLPLSVLVLVAAVVALVLVTGRSKNDHPTAAATTTATPSDSGSSTTSQPPTTSNTAQVTPPATVPGWQVIASGGAAVDLPPDWKVDGTNGMFDVGACGTPTSFRAKLTQESDDSPDIDTGAKNIVNFLVKEYYSNDNPQISMAPPHPTADGQLQDYKATITLTPTNSCDPPLAIVHVIVAKGDHGGTFSFALVADQHIDGAANEADLDKIASTVRAVS